MTQTAAITFKSAPKRKQKSAGKFFVGLLLFAVVSAVAFAGFCYWRQFNPFKQIQRTVLAATVPATAKPAPAAGSPKTAANSGHQPATKADSAGLADSMMAALVPSAGAETIRPELPAAPSHASTTVQPAKRMTLPPAAPASPPKPVVLTPEQKRLQVAQDGFGHIMDMAVQYPDAYGFVPGEGFGDVRLGNEIPVHRIGLPDGGSYAGQPVSSLLKPGDEWVFPIILNNHVRYMVQVKYDGHDYVLGTGSRALAMAYDKILARWPADKGFHPQLISVPNLPFYYFSIPELPDPNITDTSRMFDIHPSLSPASIALANCR